MGVNFIFFRKKGDFFGRFSFFYGQPLVTAAWATRSPWSIYKMVQSLFNYLWDHLPEQINVETFRRRQLVKPTKLYKIQNQKFISETIREYRDTSPTLTCIQHVFLQAGRIFQ